MRIDRGAADSRRSGRWIWTLVAVFLLATLAAGSAWWWSSGAAVVNVRAIAAEQRGATEDSTVLNASGYVTARRRATVGSKITGKLVEVRVEEGMPVDRGRVLARLDDAQYAAALALADSRLDAARRVVDETRARLDLAALTLERTRRLVADDVMGQADLDEAKTAKIALEARIALELQEVAVGEHEVELRRTELEDTVIRAPFKGVVVSKDAQPGETVSPMSAGGAFTRSGICTIVDMESLEIEVDVNEAYLSRVQAGQPVQAVLDAYPDWSIPARVITIIPTADRQKATVRVRIGFANLDPRILPEMGVKVAFKDLQFEGSSAGKARIVVPRAALRRKDGRDVVFVVTDERVERRAVSATVIGEEAEVASGLRAGEHVVVEGPADLADGQRVELR